MENKLYKYQALLFFFGIVALNLLFVVYFDNTNITTGNGLYKAIDTNGWEKGTRFAVDNGGLLYAITMGMISKFIPDSLVSFYGEVSSFVAYRKLAWINSFFGAAASTVVLTLVYQITKDKMWALGVALVHALSSYILIDCFISEDIIPGYFFFVLSFLFFYKALEGNNVRIYLTGTTLSVIAMMLLHWSLFPPLAASYFALLCFLTYHDKSYLRLFLEQLFLFLCILYLFAKLATFFANGRYGVSLGLRGILFPSKAGTGSWVGFNPGKLHDLYLGVGQYLIGANIWNQFLSYTARNILSWGATLGSIILLLNTFFKDQRRNLQVLALFGLTIFFVGECQNLYSQPLEPQFQVEPMFIIIAGLIIAYFRCEISSCLKIGLLAFAVFMGVSNFIILQPHRHLDSVMVKGFKEFRDQFPKDTAKIVHLAYEGWSPWLMVFDYKGEWKDYLADITCLNSPFHFTPGISVEEAAQQTMNDIDIAMALGKRIIATIPWVDPEGIHRLRIQNVTHEQSTKLKEILLQNYQVKTIYKLQWGEFAEIEKRKKNG
ncbi:MAG: hypothetical protein K2W94_00190 [Alphaproteobacteria bacterium]|nr:hypothetical protein [Alphaproteobacteria bacterium]